MPSSMTPLSPAELDYLYTSLNDYPPTRPDLRQTTDFRPLQAETGVLPAVNGSAHVHSADGGEAVIGVKLEVERTISSPMMFRQNAVTRDEAMDVDHSSDAGKTKGQKLLYGRPDWITLTLTLPGVRDDDSTTVALEETLKESLSVRVGGTNRELAVLSLQDLLPINTRFHWRINIDVVLISSGPSMASASGTGSGQGSSSGAAVDYSPLPLISFGIYLALRDTRVPLLKSEGEEDPMFEDDWERSTYLYPREEKPVIDTSENAGKGKARDGKASKPATSGQVEPIRQLRPPLTLLVCAVGEKTVLFDPTREELAVADCIVALSLAVAVVLQQQQHQQIQSVTATITSLRTLDLPARDTFPGVPDSTSTEPGSGTSTTTNTTESIPGVWRPKLGGVKKGLFGKIIRSVLRGDGGGDDDDRNGEGPGHQRQERSVVEEVVAGLDGFILQEVERERDVADDPGVKE